MYAKCFHCESNYIEEKDEICLRCANFFEDENRSWEQFCSDKHIEKSPVNPHVSIKMRDDE